MITLLTLLITGTQLVTRPCVKARDKLRITELQSALDLAHDTGVGGYTGHLTHDFIVSNCF